MAIVSYQLWSAGGAMDFVGRRREISVLEDPAEAVKSSKGRALAVRGEAGTGKSALIARLVKSAPELHLVRAVGVESEMELAFGGLHQRCGRSAVRQSRDPRQDPMLQGRSCSEPTKPDDPV
jgi:hypothetical protein